VRAGSPVCGLGCAIAVRAGRKSAREAAMWDTWDWPLRSYSEAAPKDTEGGHRVREHGVAAGRSEGLKVGSGVKLEKRRRGRTNRYGPTNVRGLRSPGEPHERRPVGVVIRRPQLQWASSPEGTPSRVNTGS
jgi:hypothetical protein